MVKRVYGHLGQVRHRANVVEYQVGQHREILGKALEAARATAAFGTTDGNGANPAM